MALMEVSIVLVTLFCVTIAYFKWSFGYWKRKNVPFRRPTIPLGNLSNPLKNLETLAVRLQKHYDYFKSRGEKHGGIYVFTVPIYMPFDTEYVKRILVKDFEYFTDRGVYYNEKDDPIVGSTFFLAGSKWKNLRHKLTSAYTSGKMKSVFGTLLQCSNQMVDVLSESNKEANIKDMIERFITDAISSLAFGLECNSCKNPEEEFRKYGKMVLDFSKLEAVRNLISLAMPKLCRALGVILVKPVVSDYFFNTIKKTVEYRKINQVERKDLLQLLLNIHKDNGNGLTMTETAAEALAFYVAGFLTSSTSMSFACLEMALNTEIQDKARADVTQAVDKHGGEITYDALNEMIYLQQVFNESLRKYPINPVLIRKCGKEYKIPDTDTILDKGTRIFISTLAIHRDPDNYPEPEKFDPERFSADNKSQIKPFGDGPRNCMGIRFATMTAKLGLATLLRNFRFTFNEKTKMPITFNPNSFLLDPVGEIYLNLEKINE